MPGVTSIHHRVLGWSRQHPDGADAALAAALFALSTLAFATTQPPSGAVVQYRSPVWWGMFFVAGQSLPLIWRRRAPRVVLAVVMVSAFGAYVIGFSESGGTFTTIIAMYTVASLAERKEALVAFVWSMLIVEGVNVAGMVTYGTAELPPIVLVANFIIYFTAWAIGIAVRNRRALLDQLEQRAVEAEQRQTEAAQRAVIDERQRIAREMHDVVAHSLSVMVVQAGAARRVLAERPDVAVDSLLTIEQTGREAMGEMRRLLGVMRQRDDAGQGPAAPVRSPQPGLDALPALVDHWNQVGLPVTLTLDGNPRPLPGGIDLAAYRIVQEALTNTAKHAGPAKAEVRVDFGDDTLGLEVLDDGRGAAATDHPAGHGLVGMRERTELFGGRLDAGARPGGGFRVRALLPIGVAAHDATTTSMPSVPSMPSPP
jgi:signal transduction histidine kinase